MIIHAQPRKLDPAATRERIEAAAVAEIAEKGEAASVADIARRAGVADGALYRHYPSKEAMVRAIFVRHFIAFGRTLDTLQAGRTDLAGRLGAVVEGVYALHDAEPQLYRFLLLNQHPGLGALPDDDASPVRRVMGLVEQAMAAGEIPAQPPALAAAFVFGLVIQPTVFAVYGRLPGPMRPRAAAVTAACLRALGHQEPTP